MYERVRALDVPGHGLLRKWYRWQQTHHISRTAPQFQNWDVQAVTDRIVVLGQRDLICILPTLDS